jgi:ADP-ribosyl-[dinitrogen reductase] hydrolase
MLGGAIGDALGMDLEIFPNCSDLAGVHTQVLKARSEITEKVCDYREGGPWKHMGIILKAGEWTDDTAMMLCLADSLLVGSRVVVGDLMERFCNWWGKGYNSCNGRSVGLGGNIAKAIQAFDANAPHRILGGTNPERDAGNGSLMRLAPVPIFWHTDLTKALMDARLQTATTHNVDECMDGSTLMAYIIWHGINGSAKAIFDELESCPYLKHYEIREITYKNAAWRTKKEEEIRTLPGRCLWSLEAALWCVYTTDSFRDALVKAVNLTGDADTIASITGQIAGAIYGLEGIPEKWREGLKHADKIALRAGALFDRTEYDAATMTLDYGRM